MTLNRPEIEERVIGALLCHGNDSVRQAAEILTPEDFRFPDCRLFFSVCYSLVLSKKNVDLVTLHTFIIEQKDTLVDYLFNISSKKETKQLIAELAVRATELMCRHEPYGFDLVSCCHFIKQENRRERLAEIVRNAHARILAGDNVEVISQELLEETARVSHTTLNEENYLTGDVMLTMEMKEEISLVRGLIRAQSVNFIFGEEGCGKSLLAMNLGIGVATGAAQFLSYKVLLHGKVLYLNNELPFSEFHSRFKGMAEALPPERQQLLSNLLVPKSVPTFDSYWGEINRLCRSEKPVMVVLDCLYWSHDKKENDSSDMKNIMRQFASLRDEHQLAVIVVHHTKKGSRYQGLHNDNMRGSGVFGAAADTNMELRRSEKDISQRILKPTKLRYGKDAMREARLLSLCDTTLWFRDHGATDEEEHIGKREKEPTSQEAIDFREILKEGEVVARKEIINRCASYEYSMKTIDRLIQQARENGILQKVDTGKFRLEESNLLYA